MRQHREMVTNLVIARVLGDRNSRNPTISNHEISDFFSFLTHWSFLFRTEAFRTLTLPANVLKPATVHQFDAWRHLGVHQLNVELLTFDAVINERMCLYVGYTLLKPTFILGTCSFWALLCDGLMNRSRYGVQRKRVNQFRAGCPGFNKRLTY